MSDERWPDDGAVEALRESTDVILKAQQDEGKMFNALPEQTLKAFIAWMEKDKLECASRLGTVASLCMAIQSRLIGKRTPKGKA